MKISTTSVAIGFVMLSAALGGGCGSGGSATTVTVPAGPTSAPSKAQYIATVDRECQAGNARIQPVKAQLSKFGSSIPTDKLASLLDQSLAIMRPELAKLRAITPPAGDEATAMKLWEAIDSEITDLQNLSQALGNGDTSGITPGLYAIEQARALAKGLAQGYGFHHCGAGS